MGQIANSPKMLLTFLQTTKAFVLTVTSLCLIVTFCNAQTDRYLQIPALGRFSELGFLYDERTDKMIDLSVFRQKVPSESVIESQSPRTTRTISEATTTNYSFEKLSQLFDLPLDTALNIAVGILKVKGAAKILNSFQNNNAPTSLSPSGTLLVKQETVVQRLQIFYDGLRPYYNIYLLNSRRATHVVTGITWGAQVAVTLSGAAATTTTGTGSSSEVTPDEVNSQIRNDIVKLKSGNLTTEEENSNFTISINSDVTLPNQAIVVPTSLKEVQQFLLEFPDQIRSLNDGKGVPLEFKLTPISLVQEFLNVPSRRANVAIEVPGAILKNFTCIFSNVGIIEQRITTTQNILFSQPNCITAETVQKIQELNSQFLDSKWALKHALESLLVQVRSGNESTSSLETLANDYNNNFSFQSFQTKMAEFNKSLVKVSFCKTIQEEEGGRIEYFGSNQNLLTRISQNSNKSVFILFIKTEFTQEDPVKYTENLNTFLRGFDTSSTQDGLMPRFIVDCDFQQPFCSNVSHTAIHTYKNGKLVLADLKETEKEESTYVIKQIKELQNDTSRLIKFIGENVVLKSSKCNEANICLNGGSCINTKDGLDCTCPVGFEGLKCERQTDNCESSPCKNNGACRSSVNNFTCTCPQGFTGKICDVNVDECQNGSSTNPCKNGGHCIDEVGGYTCVCPFPWSGKNCQYEMEDPCRLNLCKNGAICIASLNHADFVCSCGQGYTGTLCEDDIDECSRNASVCSNGRVCRNTNGSFACDCAAGFEGTNCEINIDECQVGNRCLNGGTCVDGINSFSCVCAEGFMGTLCDKISEVAVCSASAKASRDEMNVVTMNEAGLIKIPNLPYSGSFLFEYKPTAEHLDNQKSSLWTLDNLHNGHHYVFKLKLTLLCSNPLDTISALDWKFIDDRTDLDTVLSSAKLTNSTEYNLIQNWAIKLFLSYASADGQSSGFLVLIDIFLLSNWSFGNNFIFTNGASPGSLLIGPTRRHDKISIVINPKATHNSTLTVKNMSSAGSLSTSCNSHWDAIDVYEIPPITAPHKFERLCKLSSFPVSFTSQWPLLVTFLSESYGGNNASLLWE